MADRNIEVFRRVSLGGTTLTDGTQAGVVVSHSVKNYKYQTLTFDASTSSQIIANTEGYTNLSVRFNKSGTADTPTADIRLDMSPDQSGVFTAKLGMRNMQNSDNTTAASTDNAIPGQYQRGDLYGSAVQINISGLTTDTVTAYVVMS